MDSLDEPAPGTYDICAVCGWENDLVQFDDPDFRGGANRESLREAQAQWLQSREASVVKNTGRLELSGRVYQRDPNWRPI